jgi:hypothetical protein
VGSSQLPAASDHFDTAFMRMVREQFSQFQGLPTQNNLDTLLKGHDFDPTLGMGRILIEKHGIPACHILLHADDILVRGPNHDKDLCSIGLDI